MSIHAVYEYGAWRKLEAMRWQAYAVLAGSFARIFFANLTTGEPGQWLSTRVLTVIPIAAIEYYMFSREQAPGNAGIRRRLDPALVFAYVLGIVGSVGPAASGVGMGGSGAAGAARPII